MAGISPLVGSGQACPRGNRGLDVRRAQQLGGTPAESGFRRNQPDYSVQVPEPRQGDIKAESSSQTEDWIDVSWGRLTLKEKPSLHA